MEFTETKLECYSEQGRGVVKQKDKETQTLPSLQGLGVKIIREKMVITF